MTPVWRDIVTVVLRLYRQGDAAMRDRCLNVVDKLADVGAYGLPEALQHERCQAGAAWAAPLVVYLFRGRC